MQNKAQSFFLLQAGFSHDDSSLSLIYTLVVDTSMAIKMIIDYIEGS